MERAHRVRARTALQCTYTPHTPHATAAQNDKTMDKTLCGNVSEEDAQVDRKITVFINVDIRIRKRLPPFYYADLSFQREQPHIIAHSTLQHSSCRLTHRSAPQLQLHKE